MIGAHLSTSQGLPAMVRNAVALGASCAQIFTSSPQQWRGKQYTAAEGAALQAALAETGVGPIISHDSYLINLASTDPVMLEKSRDAFREELLRCGVLGLPMAVMHLGAYKGGTLEEGLARLAESLNLLIPVADAAGVQIVLETTAGQGTYLGGDFAQFPQIFSMIPAQQRLGVCLDTCHVFVAGYDLRDAEHYAQLWAAFDEHIGLERLKVIHVNDTERALGSHGDRHANIGQGQLGLEAFRLLMQDARLAGVPKILETPGGEAQHGENLRMLRALAAEVAQ
jgi:deoxyribonuclease-4